MLKSFSYHKPSLVHGRLGVRHPEKQIDVSGKHERHAPSNNNPDVLDLPPDLIVRIIRRKHARTRLVRRTNWLIPGRPGLIGSWVRFFRGFSHCGSSALGSHWALAKSASVNRIRKAVAERAIEAR